MSSTLFQPVSKRIFAVAALILLSASTAWSGSYKVLHVFKKNSQIPSSGLIVDAAGNGYGTTAKGGYNNAGTVYQLSPTSGYHIIYAFSGHPEGEIRKAIWCSIPPGIFMGRRCTGERSPSATAVWVVERCSS